MKTDIEPKNRMPQSPAIVKPVATYYRVSTDNQETEGTSLDTQREACLKYCKEHGYQVTHQFIETWTGTELERPKLDELRQAVRNEEIIGCVIYSLDRLSRDPVHGVIITEEFEKHHVGLEAVTESVDNTEVGKLITYIKGFSAKLEVERLRDRMGRGFKARVFDKKLPITFREPYGYTWDKESTRLMPNDDYENAKLILNLALEGKTYGKIIAELEKRGILSPDGVTVWNKATISRLLHNPLYAGQYYAFKTQVVEPKKRNGSTYGKSSVIRLPQDQWHYIPEIEVIDPPMTLDQRTLLLAQLEQRQKLASRNAKRTYLLRGRIFCETHKGKGGAPRVYHGQPRRNGSWRYVCPVGKCDSQHLDGPGLEKLIFLAIWRDIFLQGSDEFIGSLQPKSIASTAKYFKAELVKCKKEAEKTINKQVVIENRWLDGKYSDEEVYQRLRSQCEERRTYLQHHTDELLTELAQLSKQEEAIESIKQLRGKYSSAFLKSIKPLRESELSRPPDLITIWRQILDTLNVRVHIYPNDATGDYIRCLKVGKKSVPMQIKAELPIPIELHEVEPD